MTDTNPSIGDVVLGGQFRLAKSIGMGGMGLIFLAEHVETGRKAAIKFLRHRHTDNPQAIERLRQEARLAGTIGHDNICEVTDMGTEVDFHYLVMPYLKGTSLDRLIAKDKELPLHRVLDIMGQTLSALDAAHQRQIIHRDLKPSNIFITRVGDRNDFVKLLDFGISKVMGAEAPLELTDTGVALGTPYYMAPEIAQGARSIDVRVDIYAAGVILYEVLTGTRPFEGKSYNEVMFKIVSEQYPLPRIVNPLIPEEVAAVIVKAMSRSRENRYETAEQMRIALADCPREFLERASADALLASTMSPKTVAPFTTPADEPEKKTVSHTPPHQLRRGLLIGLAVICALLAVGLMWPTGTRESPKPAKAPPAPEVTQVKEGKAPVPALEPPPKEPQTPSVAADPPTQTTKAPAAKKPPKGPVDKPPVDKDTGEDEPNTVDGHMGTIIVTEF